MAVVKPFRGYRPPSKMVEEVASKPYDVMNRNEAKEMAGNNAHSFLRIIRPEIEFEDSVSAYDEKIYQRAKDNFQKFVKAGTLVQDDKPCYYIYRLVMGDVDQTGIVGLCSIDDYWNEVIKKHEYTRPVKEKDRITNMRVSGIQPGPVFSAFKKVEALDSLVEKVKAAQKPTYDFTADDGVLHQVWVVNDKSSVDQMESELSKIPEIYIADGHHRAASGSKVGQALRREKGITAEAPYNYFLSVIFPHNQVSIIDYNRVIKDLNGRTSEAFLDELKSKFKVSPLEQQMEKPNTAGSYGMYLDGKWYKLQLNPDLLEKADPVDSLDISLLDKHVLKPLLNIQDQRTDKRIDFVGGIRGLEGLKKRVDSGEMKLAFAIPAVSVEELFKVADSGKVMPPKSTWFEPKLRSGLFIHQIDS